MIGRCRKAKISSTKYQQGKKATARVAIAHMSRERSSSRCSIRDMRARSSADGAGPRRWGAGLLIRSGRG
jgi:hypothetical protein